MRHLSVFILILVLVPLSLFAQQTGDRVTLVLTNGYSVKGTLVQNDPSMPIVIRVASGEELTYERNMVTGMSKGNAPNIGSGSGSRTGSGLGSKLGGFSGGSINFAEGSGGVILSINKSGLSKYFRDQENKKGLTNLSIAFFGIAPIKDKISLQAELIIESKGFKMGNDELADNYHYGYGYGEYDVEKYTETLLQIPVMINYELNANPKISLLVGPSLALKISDSNNGFLGNIAVETGLHLGTQLEHPINENFNFIGRIKFENSMFRHGTRFNGLSFGAGISMKMNNMSSVIKR